MPFYEWRCACGEGRRVFAPMSECRNAPICNCGGSMERDYGAEHGGHIPASAFPYTTRNLTPDGSPVEVRSAAHLSSLCRQYGVRHRDDSAFEDVRMEFNKQTGRVEPTAGSGRGMKGQWV